MPTPDSNYDPFRLAVSGTRSTRSRHRAMAKVMRRLHAGDRIAMLGGPGLLLAGQRQPCPARTVKSSGRTSMDRRPPTSTCSATAERPSHARGEHALVRFNFG